MKQEQLRTVAVDPVRVAYGFMLLLLVLITWLHLGTPLLAALFSYLALRKLQVLTRGNKWAAVGIFTVLVLGAAYGLGYFIRQTVHALPEIADKAIPSILTWAGEHGIELPFSDYSSFKEQTLDLVQSSASALSSFAKVARGASTGILFLAAGCVVAISFFLTPRFELSAGPSSPANNLYTLCSGAIAQRFAILYRSFVTVMGAQIIISAINTVLTGIFAFAVHLPYAVVVIGMTFLCGLLPVVGNLISNTIIVGIGFTVSPRMALAALVFLVVIHKLEYFLNSSIVGWRIRNPLWLTLLGLIVGERLLGLPGMVLAPVVLNYIRLETSRLQVAALAPAKPEPPEVTWIPK